MPLYNYSFTSNAGKQVTGRVRGDNQSVAIEKLQKEFGKAIASEINFTEAEDQGADNATDS